MRRILQFMLVVATIFVASRTRAQGFAIISNANANERIAVTCIDSTHDTAQSRHWFFGDGTDTLVYGAHASSVMHTYTDTGRYTCTLVVSYTGTNARKDTFSQAISFHPQRMSSQKCNPISDPGNYGGKRCMLKKSKSIFQLPWW